MISTIQLQNEDIDLLKGVTNKYVSSGLNYGWKSNSKLSYDQGHWNKQIVKNSKHFPCDMSSTPVLSRHPEVEKLWKIINFAVGGSRGLLRAYINGYTYGTDGYAHRDDEIVNVIHGRHSVAETAIVYLNKEWDINWCGETVIFDEDKEIAASVLPKYGRVLVFDSHMLHAARPLSRVCGELRLILAIKTFDLQIVSEPIKFLQKNATAISHSNKTFFEHLFNTMLNLESRKNDKDVLLAGLFHSIYGTEYFQHNLHISREFVKNLIGDYSESLAYEFCTIKNRYHTLMTNSNNYSDIMHKDLVEIEIANLKDQNHNNRYEDRISELDNVISKYPRM